MKKIFILFFLGLVCVYACFADYDYTVNYFYCNYPDDVIIDEHLNPVNGLQIAKYFDCTNRNIFENGYMLYYEGSPGSYYATAQIGSDGNHMTQILLHSCDWKLLKLKPLFLYEFGDWVVNYTFDGWYTAKEGGIKLKGEDLSDCVRVANDCCFYAHWRLKDEFIITEESIVNKENDHTLHACYQKNSYKVAFIPNIPNDAAFLTSQTEMDYTRNPYREVVYYFNRPSYYSVLFGDDNRVEYVFPYGSKIYGPGNPSFSEFDLSFNWDNRENMYPELLSASCSYGYGNVYNGDPTYKFGYYWFYKPENYVTLYVEKNFQNKIINYSFDGWYTEEVGGEKLEEGSVVYPAGVEVPLTYYGHWTPRENAVPEVFYSYLEYIKGIESGEIEEYGN